MNKSVKIQFPSLGLLIFLIFLTLKLADIGQVATWSWWWVTAPLWMPAGFLLGLGVLCIVLGAILQAIAKACKT